MVRDTLQAQSDDALTAQRIDPAAFYTYARTHHAKALQTAMYQHYESRSLAPYASILASYRASLAANTPEVPREAPPQPTPRPEREPLVTIGGQVMPERLARRIGLVQ